MLAVKPRKPVCKSLSETIRLVHQGDAEAFGLIYRSYSGFVHRICLRMLRDPAKAEDVVQDAFVQLFRKIHTFRGNSEFSSWLYRLTTNLVLMRLRKRNHELSSLDDRLNDEDGGSLCSEIGRPDLHLTGLFDRLNLQAAIKLLPDGYKAAFILHDVQGYNHREIAKLLGYSMGNSKSQLHKARKRLRELLSDSSRSELRKYSVVGLNKNWTGQPGGPERHKIGTSASPAAMNRPAEHPVVTPRTSVGPLQWSPDQKEIDAYIDSLNASYRESV